MAERGEASDGTENSTPWTFNTVIRKNDGYEKLGAHSANNSLDSRTMSEIN
jgi:hypothetical protein